MTDHPIIEQYLEALTALREKNGFPFLRTMRDVPDESGIYMLTDTDDQDKCYYVGISKGMRSSISYFSDGSSSGSAMVTDLISQGLIKSRREAKDWMRSHVEVRWLRTEENPVSDYYLHQFLVAVLRPRHNEERER